MSENKKIVIEELMSQNGVIEDLRRASPKYLYSPQVIHAALKFEKSHCNWFLISKDVRFISNVIDSLVKYPDDIAIPEDILMAIVKHDVHRKLCTFDDELNLLNALLQLYKIPYEIIVMNDGGRGPTWFMIDDVKPKTADNDRQPAESDISIFIEGYASEGKLDYERFSQFRSGFLIMYNNAHRTRYMYGDAVTDDTLMLLNDLLKGDPDTAMWEIVVDNSYDNPMYEIKCMK